MSYNLLSGNVNFVGTRQGTVEDLVDTHTTQTIQGQKTFSGVLTASNIAVADDIIHTGDADTKIRFGSDNIALIAGTQILTCYGNLSPKRVQVAGSDFKIDTSGLDFYVDEGTGYVGIGVDPTSHALQVVGAITASHAVSASYYYGNAMNLTNVTSSAITGLIHPEKILKGTSLISGSGGLIVNLSSASGLESVVGGLKWSPNDLATAASLAAGDYFGIYDADVALPKKVQISTLSSLVLGDAAVTSYNGTNVNRVLTSGGEDTIDVEANLTFDGSTLAVTGAISGSTTLHIGSHISGSGDLSLRWGLAQVANLYATADITGSSMLLAGDVVHDGDTDTKFGFAAADNWRVMAGGTQMLTTYGNLATKKVQVDGSDFKVVTSGMALFITSSTGRVGIGVADPDHALEILSGSTTQLKLSYDASNSVTLGSDSGGDLTITPSGGDITLDSNVAINGNTIIGNSSLDTLTINSLAVTLPNGLNFDSNTLFISASNDRVGIGTASPAQKLSVVGSVSASAELIINTVSASAQIHAPNIASGTIAGNGSYLGLSNTGHIVLTSSADTVDIDALSALGGTGLHDSQDHFMFSDNGTEKKITWANLYGATFSKVSGDATVASGGALTLANNSVEADQIATSVAGDGLTGGGGAALAVQVSGAVKIQSDKVALTGSLAGDGLGYLGGVDSISSLKVNVDDSSIEVNSDSLRVKASGITDSMMNDDVASGLAGDGLTASSGVMAVQTSGSLRITSDKVAISGSLAGNGLDYSGGVDSIASLSVDVSDFMTNGSDNRVVTATGTDGMNGEANLTFDGSTLTVTGDSTIDKNHSDTDATTITGLQIDFDKTGNSTSDNTTYGLNIDMDNTTATNGNNYMYGLYVTPTLTHAADAGGSFVYGALINAQGNTNGSSFVQGARIEAGGGDINYGLQLDVEDGGVDLRIESSADSGDYFQIQTTAHGATTITTVDDDATAANLTFNVDGDITLDPAGGNIVLDGQVAIGTTGTANRSLAVSGSMRVSGSDVQMSFGSSPQLQLSASKSITGNTSLLEITTPTKANLFSVNEAGMVGVDMVPAAFNASLYVSGAAVVGAPTAALNNANLHSGSYSFYLDEGSNKLMVSVRYSNGTMKSGSILLD